MAHSVCQIFYQVAKNLDMNLVDKLGFLGLQNLLENPTVERILKLNPLEVRLAFNHTIGLVIFCLQKAVHLFKQLKDVADEGLATALEQRDQHPI